jgi:carbamate kinase
MGATAVVGLRCEVDPAEVAGAVRALVLDGWKVVVTARSGDVAGPLALALGVTRAGRRAVPIATHTLVDPLDPAFAHPPLTASPEPLAILESEGIGALLDGGFPVVVSGHMPVVPHGDDYRAVEAALDGAAAAQRLANDLGASALVFVAGDDELRSTGDIDLFEAERRIADGPGGASELTAAARFVAAGGEVASLTTAEHLAEAVDGPADGGRALRIYRRVARPRSDAPALAAGWC